MKLYERIWCLSQWLRFKATYLEMKYQLKQVLKGKEINYIKPIYYHDRCIGKSVALARLSAKYNIPVVVPTHTWKRLIEVDIPKYLPKYFKKKKPTAIVINNIRSIQRLIVLFEEGLTNEEINMMAHQFQGTIIGYRNID